MPGSGYVSDETSRPPVHDVGIDQLAPLAKGPIRVFYPLSLTCRCQHAFRRISSLVSITVSSFDSDGDVCLNPDPV